MAQLTVAAQGAGLPEVDPTISFGYLWSVLMVVTSVGVVVLVAFAAGALWLSRNRTDEYADET